MIYQNKFTFIFQISTLQKTTYYLVYHYKNADTAQDAQQGKSFSGEISVKLILEKSDQCELDDEILACSILSQAKNDTTNLATDDYGNTYPALNDATHYLGTTLEQHTLTSSDGNTVTVTQTTNGDYYYRDDNGIGFSDNGDGTWIDENGNTYTE